jgi:hypothetical protein
MGLEKSLDCVSRAGIQAFTNLKSVMWFMDEFHISRVKMWFIIGEPKIKMTGKYFAHKTAGGAKLGFGYVLET